MRLEPWVFYVTFILVFGCQEVPIEDSYIQEAKPQELNERIIVGEIPNIDVDAFRKLLRDNAVVDTLVFNVMTGVVTTQEYVYIVDNGDYSVKKYRKSDGHYIRKYSKGRGSGPGEIMNPLSFQTSLDGGVWVLDNGNRRISVFEDSTGDILESIEINVPFAKGVIDASMGRVVVHHPRDSHLFKIYELDRELYSVTHYMDVGNWVSDQSDNHYNLHGEIRLHPDGGVYYYLSSHDGWLYAGDMDGKDVFLRKTIDNLELAKNSKRDETDNGYYVETKNAVMHVLLSVWNENLYAWRADVETFTGYIDVYSARTGDYIESFKSGTIPQCRMQGVMEDHVYFTCDTVDYSYVTRVPLNGLRYNK